MLNAQALASHVDRDAYEAKTVSLSGGIERQSNFIWQKKWTWSLGAELVATDERDTIEATGEQRRRTFFIAALPASLGYDGSDDLLDPTKGFRLLGRLSPELSASRAAPSPMPARRSTPAPIARCRTAWSPPGGSGWARSSARAATTIAPSRRFYAGGGGSVRGYGYQRLGPRDVDDDPIGGRSLAEFSARSADPAEGVRRQFRDRAVHRRRHAVDRQRCPSLKDWQFGAGIGARYYSSFGPIRIDVGTPLNRQKGDGRIAVVGQPGPGF